MERDFKSLCGFRGVSGHRLWRKLKNTLLRAGCIREELVTVNGKACTVIWLLRGYSAKGAPEDEGDAPQIDYQMVAELSLSPQILLAVLEAGAVLGLVLGLGGGCWRVTPRVCAQHSGRCSVRCQVWCNAVCYGGAAADGCGKLLGGDQVSLWVGCGFRLFVSVLLFV